MLIQATDPDWQLQVNLGALSIGNIYYVRLDSEILGSFNQIHVAKMG